MAKTVLYQHGDDNVAPNATWKVDTLGTVDPDYRAAYIADEIFTKPAKLTTTTGGWVAEFSADQRVDLVALGVHNIDPGATVVVQGNGTDSWGSPTLNTTLTIAADAEDGRVCHAWKDLTGVTGYTTGGFNWWRISVTASNTTLVSVGEVWLGKLKRTFDRAYQWEYETSDARRTVEHVTQYGARTVYDLLVQRRAPTNRRTNQLFPGRHFHGAALRVQDKFPFSRGHSRSRLWEQRGRRPPKIREPKFSPPVRGLREPCPRVVSVAERTLREGVHLMRS